MKLNLSLELNDKGFKIDSGADNYISAIQSTFDDTEHTESWSSGHYKGMLANESNRDCITISKLGFNKSRYNKLVTVKIATPAKTEGKCYEFSIHAEIGHQDTEKVITTIKFSSTMFGIAEEYELDGDLTNETLCVFLTINDEYEEYHKFTRRLSDGRKSIFYTIPTVSE